MRLALLLAASAAVAGCGLVGGRIGGFSGSGGCTNIQGGACSEQLEKVGARHPGATGIDLECTAAACNRKGGSGTAVVTMSNGAIVKDTFAYAGDPAPVPPPSCTGVPPDTCRSLADGQVEGISPSKRILAIDVRCTSAVCGPNKGEADVTVRLADGSTQQGGSSWDGGPP